MDIKEFLQQNEIKELIAENDLEGVYRKYASQGDICSEISDYLLSIGVNPIDYFEKSIPDFAFHDADSLTNVVISDGVTDIGYMAFYDCTSLVSVFIPDSVTRIGEKAFAYCTDLVEVTFGENSELDAIGYAAFHYCDYLASIVIPDSVTIIGSYAFYHCTSLTDIYYNGTKKQWTKIIKCAHWDTDTPVEVIHCIDGDISLE